MADYAELLSAASQLPIDERMRLIDELYETIPSPGETPLSPEWTAVIERRSEEIEAGTVEGVPWETVRQDLFRRVGLDGGA